MATTKRANRASPKPKKSMQGKAAPKSSKTEISFSLQRLMNEHPCNEGLCDALRFLRSKRSVKAPRELWPLISKLEKLSYESFTDKEERDIRREIRKIADDVKIIVKPKVFAERLIEGDEFFEYVEKLLKRQAVSQFKKNAYELIKEDLVIGDSVEEKIADSEEKIQHAKQSLLESERQLNALRQDIRRTRHEIHLNERELNSLKTQKETGQEVKEYLPLSEFNPFDVIQDSWNEYDLSEEKRLIIAEEMARALAI